MLKYACGLALVVFSFMLTSASYAQSDSADTAVRVSKFADWGVRCVTAEKTVCRSFQNLYLNLNGKRKKFATVSIGKDDVRIDGPLGVLLDAGATITVGDHSETAPFRYCVRSGCRAVGPFSDKLTNLFKLRDVAFLSFQRINGKKMQAQVSLNGFSRATLAMLEQSK